MNPNTELNLALQLIEQTGNHLFLTGKAGTGKTTFLRNLRKASPKRMIVVAPTGVAAMNAGGVTIHSFFQLSFSPFIPADTPGTAIPASQLRFSKEKINIIRSLDLLVIDEVSMVRADVLDAIDEVLRRYRDRRKPFGGVQLLLIGDIQQLAPVAKEEEWNILRNYYKSSFFFDSMALRECTYFCIELTHIYRQTDNEFITLLNNIRDNQLDEETLHLLNTRYKPGFTPKPDEGYITLTTHNIQARQLNEKRLQELEGRLYRYEAEIADEFPEYLYPTDKQLELKRGAQIMFIKNDTSGEKRYYNGKIGKIVLINPTKIVVADEQGQEMVVEQEIWHHTKYTINQETKEITETIAGSFRQYPLKTAWAITIHKSQGLTFEHAIIDAGAAFSYGQVYVALSRCTSLEGLVLTSPIGRNALVGDRQIYDFVSSIPARQPDNQQVRQAELVYYKELLTELFDFARIQQQLQYAAYVIEANLQRIYPELCRMFGSVRDTFREHVTEVGIRFQQQLSQMLQASPDYKQDQQIAERIRKGIPYFLDKFRGLTAIIKEAEEIEIDNKKTRKLITNALQKLDESTTLKEATLLACRETFSIPVYLSAKAKASLSPPSAAKKRSTSKASKAGKVTVPSDILHPRLYEIFRAWRSKQAKTKGLPAYTILQQKAMIGIVNLLPVTPGELLKIPGIGKKVIDNHGEKILQLVTEYLQNNKKK
ncbi:MAG: AAA family ATPase [Tannerellaceae bacterium]|nr:AAA family ATPase [Tannerellaceae bacterium]